MGKITEIVKEYFRPLTWGFQRARPYLSIGAGLNWVCDRLDKPSDKPLPESTIKYFVWGVYVVTVIPALMMVGALLYLLYHFGVFGFILDWFIPIRDGFWYTVWTFVWHYLLTLFYACLVLAGWGQKQLEGR